MSNKDRRQAVALLAKGDWRAAHEIVQEDEESRLSRVLRGDVAIADELAALTETLRG